VDLHDENLPEDGGQPCEPEWVQMKPFLSYCTRSLAVAGVPGAGQVESLSGEKRCARKCVFAFKKS